MGTVLVYYGVASVVAFVYASILTSYGMTGLVIGESAALVWMYGSMIGHGTDAFMRAMRWGGGDDRDGSSSYDVYVYFGSCRGLCLARYVVAADPRYSLVWGGSRGIVRKARPWYRKR